MTDFTIVKYYFPGAIGRVAELHADYYHRQWGFGRFFEAKVATELAAFFSRYDDARDGFWAVCKKERLEGAIVIDGKDAAGQGAHLRWFIVSDRLRGRGAWGSPVPRLAQASSRRSSACLREAAGRPVPGQAPGRRRDRRTRRPPTGRRLLLQPGKTRG